MNRWDKGLILFMMAACLLLLLPLAGYQPQADTASVQVKNEEVLRIPLGQDGTYSVEGTLGPVNIEVKDGRIRVNQENSPHHYCSRQGFVDSVNVPIVCLPNETVITIEGEGEEDVLIQ